MKEKRGEFAIWEENSAEETVPDESRSRESKIFFAARWRDTLGVASKSEPRRLVGGGGMMGTSSRGEKTLAHVEFRKPEVVIMKL